jgi:hypothetical protein
VRISTSRGVGVGSETITGEIFLCRMDMEPLFQVPRPAGEPWGEVRCLPYISQQSLVVGRLFQLPLVFPLTHRGLLRVATSRLNCIHNNATINLILNQAGIFRNASDTSVPLCR